MNVQTIEDDEDNKKISYIKLINVGEKVITRNCHGYLPSQVAFYLQNVHIKPRKIYLSLIAESAGGVAGNVAGAESGILSEAGERYTRDLARFIEAEQRSSVVAKSKEVIILAGSAKIHSETISKLKLRHSCFFTPLLNELRGGDFHGISKQQFKVNHIIFQPKHSSNRSLRNRNCIPRSTPSV